MRKDASIIISGEAVTILEDVLSRLDVTVNGVELCKDENGEYVIKDAVVSGDGFTIDGSIVIEYQLGEQLRLWSIIANAETREDLPEPLASSDSDISDAAREKLRELSGEEEDEEE